MVAGSHTEISVCPISVDRLWRASGDSPNLIPKLLPQMIQSIDILEGDGGAGTVKKFNFTGDRKAMGSITDKTLVLDHEKHVYKYEILEGGEIGGRFISSVFEIKLEATSEGGSKTTLTWEFETLGDHTISDEEAARIVTGVLSMNKAIEAHLVANPDAYA